MTDQQELVLGGGPAAEPPSLRIANTVATIEANVQMVQHLMRKLMVQDVHYGVIPGTDKATLYQPGAEMIALAFQWSARWVNIDLSTDDVVRYRVTCELYSRTGGQFVGAGQGEASSDEEKYHWRKAISAAEYDDTPEDRRRLKYYKNGGTAKQVRTVPADIANTVLKMASKRAFIHATRTASGCSDMFAQDLEDLPDEVRETVTGQDQSDQATEMASDRLGEENWQLVVAAAPRYGYTEADLLATAKTEGHDGVGPDMPVDLANRLVDAMKANPKKEAKPKPAARKAQQGQDGAAGEASAPVAAPAPQAAKSPEVLPPAEEGTLPLGDPPAAKPAEKSAVELGQELLEKAKAKEAAKAAPAEAKAPKPASVSMLTVIQALCGQLLTAGVPGSAIAQRMVDDLGIADLDNLTAADAKGAKDLLQGWVTEVESQP